MSRLIRLALSNRVFPNLLMLGLIVAGLLSLFTITVKNFPEIETDAVQVTVLYPGATPQEVSDAVLEPIENALRPIEGIRRITGTATQDTATVIAELVRGVDRRRVRDEIETEVNGISSFPEAVEEPTVLELEPEELAIEFVLSGDLDRATLKRLGQQARDDLQALPGISQVELRGVPASQIAVEVPGDRLRAHGLGLADVADLVAGQSLDLSAGTLLSDRERLQVRTVGQRETGTALEGLPILTSAAGAQVTLGDVARIRDGLAEEGILAELDGRPAVFLTVRRAGDEQLLDVVDAARSHVAKSLRPRLPETVSVTEWRNEATSLRGRISLLVKNAAMGAALILVVLALVLDLRIAAWVAAGIAISFVGTFALMQLAGITVNQMSLFAFILALGIVVDDAIVVGEAVYTERQRTQDGHRAAVEGATRMARPIFYSVATTILAFVPLLVLPGASGSFIGPVAAVVIMVLALSLTESFFILPQHLAHLGMNPPRRFSPRRLTDPLRARVGGGLDRFADRHLRRWVSGAVARPLMVLVGAAGLFLASLALVTNERVRFVFFPDIEGDYVSASLVLPDGSSAARTAGAAARLVAAAERARERIAEEVGAEAATVAPAIALSIGEAPVSGGPSATAGASPAEATVEVKLQESDLRAFTARRFADLWRDETGEIPGAEQLSFSGTVVGVGADIALQVGAETEAARAEAVARIREALETRPGVSAVRDSESSSGQEVAVSLNAHGQALGIPLAALASEVRAAIYGIVASEIQRNREEVEVRVRLPAAERATLADLADHRIRLGEAFVPLSSVADLEQRPAPTTLTRIDGLRVTTIEADVDNARTSGGAETQRILEDLVPRLAQDLPGLTVTLGGEQDEQSRFGPALARNFVLALFAIYAVLALAFRSYGRPFLIMAVMPFGLGGALVGHALLGLDLTLLSMFGIVGLMGIIVNDALLIVTRVIEEEEAGAKTPIADAVTSRFRPVLLTTLTTCLGIAPLILERSLQAQFLIPTAVSLAFGLLLAAPFILLVLPALCALYARWPGPARSPLIARAAD